MRLAALLLLVPLLAHAGLFGNNKVDDVFTVKSLAAGSAVLEGDPKGLKEGDVLYFARSPYVFTVTAVKGHQITVALPEKNDVAMGNTMMRKENDQIRKSIETEKRLKSAVEE